MGNKYIVKVFILLLILSSCTGPENNTYSDYSTSDPIISDFSMGTDTSSAQTPVAKLDDIYYIDERLPYEIQEVVISNREALFETALDIDTELFTKHFLLDYNEAEDDAVVSILEKLQLDDAEVLEMNREAAIEDVTFLMDYLKYFYGGYGYFGGDSVFHPIRDEIIEQLSTMEEPININDYRTVLITNLRPVIIDNHFRLDSMPVISPEFIFNFLVNEEYLFNKNGDVFISADDEYEFISAYANENEISLLPYLDESGYFVWALGFTCNSGTPVIGKINIKEIATGINETLEVRFGVARQYTESSGAFYDVLDRKGLKIIASRRLRLNENEDYGERIEYMFNAGKELENESVILLDLRRNSGGNSTFAMAWIQGLLDLEKRPNSNTSYYWWSSRETKTETYVSPYAQYDSMEAFEDNLHKMQENKELIGYRNAWDYPWSPQKYTNKDTLILVLTDNNTSSAGEFFVKALKQTENTIVIGTNTNGNFSFGNVVEIKLPYSKLSLSCGPDILLELDGTLPEGFGIQPDIWVPSYSALNRVLGFIDIYNLED